jgi:putative glutamine amidotransferase
MAADPRPPLIAVAGRILPLGRIERVLEPQLAVPTWYVESINRAGGVGAVVLPQEPADEAQAAAVIAGFDGLLLTGGVDLDPSLYGQAPHPKTYGTDIVMDRYDIALLRVALATGKPVLAICRGIQILNVAFGGTLTQHLEYGPDATIRHGIPDGGGGSANSFSIKPDSLLAGVFGELEVEGRCHHHQAVDAVADGLLVTGVAADGGVEGMELAPGATWPGDPAPIPDPWLVAVQWHPEETTATDPVQQRLFDRLVEQAVARR